MRIPWAGRGSSTRFGRGSPPRGGRKWRLLLVPAMGLAVICQLSVTGSATAATESAAATTAKAAVTSVAPNPVNELDCNGWSPKYGTSSSRHFRPPVGDPRLNLVGDPRPAQGIRMCDPSRSRVPPVPVRPPGPSVTPV